MIVVSGASGKTGRAIIARLAERGARVRAWVRRPGTQVAGASEHIIGNIESPADWAQALQGAERLYHICPNMHPNEVEIGQMALQAAAAAGVSHFVFHSVLHPQTQGMQHHWNKLLVEEMLFESGIPFTILQPTAYMQNLLPQLANIRETKRLSLPYPAETRISLVDLENVAEAAVDVLTTDQYIGATLELVGSLPLSQSDVVATASDYVKLKLDYEEIPLAKWEAMNLSLPEYARQTLLAMFRYYAEFGLVGSPAVLEMLLGRKPTSLEAFIARSI